MTYAKEPPSEPGFYWIKGGGDIERIAESIGPFWFLPGSDKAFAVESTIKEGWLFGPRVLPQSAQPASPAMGESPFDQLSELTLQFLLDRTDFSFGWMGSIGGQLAHDVQRELQASLDRKRLSTLPGGKP